MLHSNSTASVSDEVEDCPAAVSVSLGYVSACCSGSCAYRHRQDKSQKSSPCGQREDRATSKSNGEYNLGGRILIKIWVRFITIKLDISKLFLK